MGTNKPATVRLKKQYVVYMEYNTAWVDETGQVNFREDIYGHDKRHLGQLHRVKSIIQALATL